MDEARCVLVVDDDRGSLGEIALRTLRLGVDVFYAKDRSEAWLLAEQEGHQIGIVLFPTTVDVDEITPIAECLESYLLDIPRTLVVVGKKPNEAARARLRAAGVELALWEPYDEGHFRSVVSGAMRLRYEQQKRVQTRIPTTLLGRATIGVRRKDALVATLATTGAFLETPSPFRQAAQGATRRPPSRRQAAAAAVSGAGERRVGASGGAGRGGGVVTGVTG